VYESFESDAVAATGTVPMPRRREAIVGGHDIVFTGYDDTTQRFRFANPWGVGWGDKGFGTFPYAYATDPAEAGDFVVLSSVPVVGPIPDPQPVAGQIVIDLGGKSVTLPDGWADAPKSVKPFIDKCGVKPAQRLGFLREVLLHIGQGNPKGNAERIARKYGVDINALLQLIAAILALLQSLGVLWRLARPRQITSLTLLHLWRSPEV
jgi:hypothetical protein